MTGSVGFTKCVERMETANGVQQSSILTTAYDKLFVTKFEGSAAHKRHAQFTMMDIRAISEELENTIRMDALSCGYEEKDLV